MGVSQECRWRRFRHVMGVATLGLFVCGGIATVPALAQSALGNFGAFSNASNEPIDIQADTLEVFDKKFYAVLTGNVSVRQGPSTLQTKKLIIYYTKKSPEGGRQNIDRLEASGKVIISSNGRQGIANSAFYDAKSDLVTMIGDVVLNDDKSVVRGERLELNLKTGVYRMLSSNSRVRILLDRSSTGSSN